LIEFFQLFADRCHHGKEEDLLFPLLEKKGMPRAGGPLAVMLHEHTLGRSFVRQMAQAAQDFAAGVSGAGRRWAEAAREYGGVLRAHIQKENDILFVMAERMLSEEEQAGLSEAFEQVEVEKMGAGTHERLHGVMAQILAEVFPETTASR
jgi:hemerythrin-like domain-containing protein